MARTAVTVNTLTANATTALPTPTTADTTNDHSVTLPAGACLEEIVIFIKQTDASARIATIKAGDNPPALAAGLGDLAITVPATTGVVWVGPLSSARFAQSDGTLEIDLATSFAGTVTAYRIPRTA